MRRLALAASVLALAGLAGCGRSDADEARDAAESYVRKLGERDGRGTCEQMTRALQRQFTRTVARANAQLRGRSCSRVMQAALDAIPPDDLRQFARAEIEDLRVEDDSGTFRYMLAGIQVDGRVAKEDGDWKVSCCVPGAGPGG